MSALTETILKEYQIRKNKKQKQAFRDWLIPKLEEKGYAVSVEEGSMGSRNIVIGDVSGAKTLFTAHYDTCAVMPFPNFITPAKPLFYWLYQIVIMIPMFAFLFGVAGLFSLVAKPLFMVGYWVGFFVLFGFLRFGPANRHTANDNTSGVCAVLELALALPEERRQDVAFVLFDLEEMGLVGSSFFAKAHKKEMEKKLLVNLDCVSDGETMLFVLRKGAWPMLEALKAAFPADERVTPRFMTKGYIYPSDQNQFKCGVGVSALLKNRFGILYMDKIHTPKDQVFRRENIEWLVEGCLRLAEERKST